MGQSLLLVAVILSAEYSFAQYQLAFSTYVGGNKYEHIRDITADKNGNVYVAGGTASPDFPTTAKVYQRKHAGLFDIFVTKFDAKGKMVWSTLVGGKDYDRAYAIKVDGQGYVYVAGRGGRDAPVTRGVVQPKFRGQWHGGPYKSDMNAYVFKLSPDGSKLIWATFFGTGEKFRDIDIDEEGNVYGVWHDPLNPQNPHKSNWQDGSCFAKAFQKQPRGGEGDFGVVKISADGRRCIWATYLTGSGKETGAGSVRVAMDGTVYVETWTFSTDMPTTEGAYSRKSAGKSDYYIGRLSADGSKLIFGTYLGGSGGEIHSTHNLAVDQAGNAYVSVWTSSKDFPTTPGALRRTQNRRGDYSDWGIAKFSPTGALIASALIGGDAGSNPDGINVDGYGNVYLSGHTYSTDFPVSNTGAKVHARKKALVLKLSADFRQILYASYIAGSKGDDGRASFVDSKGNWYLGGEASSTNWPAHKAFQPRHAGQVDGIVAKLVPAKASR